MQLRKVCNHPDIFESRDYATPNRQLFNINYFVPYLVLTIFTKEPMQSINYKNLFLLFEEFEKVSKIDYSFLIRNFPTRHFHKIYRDIIRGKQILWNPNYMIGEGEVLFKRDYADSTILFESNTTNIRYNNHEDGSKNQIPINIQNFVCATNIPLIHNISLSHYMDILNTNYNNSKEYLNSVFKENITINKNKKDNIKLQTLYNNDLHSRKSIIYKKPLYGNDLVKIIKLNLLANDFHFSKNIVYGNQYKTYTMRNIVCSSIFNKLYHSDRSDSKHSNEVNEANENNINSEVKSKIKYYYNNVNYEGIYEGTDAMDIENNKVMEDDKGDKDDDNGDKNEVSKDNTNNIHLIEHINGNINVKVSENGDFIKGPINEGNHIDTKKDMDIEVVIGESENDNKSVKSSKSDKSVKSAKSLIKTNKKGKKVRFDEMNDNITKPTSESLLNGIKEQQEKNRKKSSILKRKPEDKVTIIESNDDNIFNKKSNIPFIHEVKTNFTESNLNPSETVHFINTENFKNLIYTPQKFLNICEDLMQNFRIHIPSVITSGPRMIPSKYNTEYYVSFNIKLSIVLLFNLITLLYYLHKII